MGWLRVTVGLGVMGAGLWCHALASDWSEAARAWRQLRARLLWDTRHAAASACAEPDGDPRWCAPSLEVRSRGVFQDVCAARSILGANPGALTRTWRLSVRCSWPPVDGVTSGERVALWRWDGFAVVVRR